ncbi:MAG: SUMF1/EgtB/PvdO family nonheme iron enzyme, partial [Myxococcota bacterium]|nr:SUMF1/EgtB/PvdO family nonheme iron enzyme [Myxococcota bacterium]
NALVKRGDKDIAETCLPKQNLLYAQQSRHASGFQRDKDGFYFLGSDKDGDRWHDRWPVMMIDYQTANRYIEWWNEQALGQWRLPKEEEWEKASRGVDGRIYPWGNHFDPNWCCMLNTPRETPILPANVDDFTVDTSPYGVRSMAGNIMEWTSSEIQQLRREHFRTFAVRGGCWYSPEHLVRLTNRQVLPESAHYSSMGFRMVCDIPPNL